MKILKTKTSITAVLILTSIFSFTSCKKADWICSCTYSQGGNEDIRLEGNMKRSEAKRLCEGSQFSVPSQGINCKLK